MLHKSYLSPRKAGLSLSRFCVTFNFGLKIGTAAPLVSSVFCSTFRLFRLEGREVPTFQRLRNDALFKSKIHNLSTSIYTRRRGRVRSTKAKCQWRRSYPFDFLLFYFTFFFHGARGKGVGAYDNLIS